MKYQKTTKRIENSGDGKANEQAIISGLFNRQIEILLKGERHLCPLQTGSKTDTGTGIVGDKVWVEALGTGEYRVIGALPRENTVYRGDRRSPGKEIAIAANVGHLLAVVTAGYLATQAGFPEQALIAAKRTGIPATLFISRWDQTPQRDREQVQQKLATYQALLPVYYGAATAPPTALLEHLCGSTVLVVGDRGSGKTALIQSLAFGVTALQPSTHTSALHSAPNGTLWVDTPGFREFHFTDITPEERALAFSELEKLAEACRFSNCTHTHEADCKVREAVAGHRVLRERYDAYQSLQGAKGPRGAKGEKKARANAPAPDYRHTPCTEQFTCRSCGAVVMTEGAGSSHRNHCPHCLCSLHVDQEPGDRRSVCHGEMEPVSVWVRKGGEWAIIHRCRSCGELSSNRIAADDNPALLLSIAVKPLAMTPFPLGKMVIGG